MPWQSHVVDVAMEVQPDGTLFYDRVVITVQRQSGKTTLILPVFVHRSIAELPGGRLDVGPQKQTVVYTAQTRNDARKKWIKEFIPLLEKSAFRRQFEKRLTNGSEGFDWPNGSTFDLVATMEKSGHGDTLDLGIIDEAFAQQDDRLEQSMGPAMITRTASQLWIVSTAGESAEKAPFLWAEVEAGRRQIEEGIESRTAYFEWSVDPDNDDPDDIEVVASRHPAVGHTITIDDLQAERDRAIRKNKLDGYYRAYCNIWGSGKIDNRVAKLPAEKWAATIGPDLPADEPVRTLTYDVEVDGSWSTIAWGARSISNPYVEIKERGDGTAWLPKRFAEIAKELEPTAMGCNGAGPAGAILASVMVELKALGIDTPVKPLSATEYHQACGGIYLDVLEGNVERPEGQPSLDAAGADAVERTLNEAWVWDRRQATVPICDLVAVTIARALLPTEVDGPSVYEERGLVVL